MKTWRMMICALLALAIGLSGLTGALAEGRYPTEWDMGELYSTPEEWRADYDRVEELIQGHAVYRGRLDNARTIAEYYQRFYMGELTQMQNKLYLYAQMGCSLDPTDATYSSMYALLMQQTSEEARLSAFVEPEIFSLTLEEREEIFSDPALEPYAYALAYFVDPDYEPMSEETRGALAILSPALGRAQSVYDILSYVEMPVPTITDPEGRELTLDAQTYANVVYGDEYDRDFKRECNQALLTRCKPYVNTLAALLDMNASTYWAQAQLDGYQSSREAALAAEDVDPQIYDLVIEAAHAGAADYQRYLAAHARGLGLTEQYPFDTAVYVSSYDPGTITYDAAVDDVREALRVLGEDYIALYDEMVNSAHIDVYPRATKDTGAFSMALGSASAPYILLNFTDAAEDAGTLAHEMGHALYSLLSARAQNPLYQDATVFTQEVASTTNELLYYTYKLQNAANDEERLFYLEGILSMFSDTFFLQALYAEFEDEMYGIVEAGYSLDAQELSDIWYDLYQEYRGSAVTAFEDSRYQWADIPHFYYNYYVYKYATSVCYAAALCRSITAGEAGAVENYLEFLSLGSSASPAELLAVAGIDPLSENTYAEALEYFAALVDEYEALIDARA